MAQFHAGQGDNPDDNVGKLAKAMRITDKDGRIRSAEELRDEINRRLADATEENSDEPRVSNRR